jgi:hypothetical protein
MREYCAYFLDSSGWLLYFELFETGSDQEAVAAVRASNPQAICQIWNGRRLVAKLDPNRLSTENDPLPFTLQPRKRRNLR